MRIPKYFYDELKSETYDYFEDIKEWKKANKNKKIFVWGTGSVAVGVIRQLQNHGISIDGCFVNVEKATVDERMEEFNLPILQLDKLVENESPFGVVVGHSHYELCNILNEYNNVSKIWCFADGARTDIEIQRTFIDEHREEFQKTYERLADDNSKRNFISFLNAKITKDLKDIIDNFDKSTSFFENDVIKIEENESYIDLGAYDGKSIGDFLNIAKVKCNKYNIIAIEIQKKMCDYIADKYGDNPNLKILNYGISDHCGIDKFVFDSQSTCLSSEGIECNVVTLDSLCEDLDKITTIKICIGGSICAPLIGAKKVINKFSPKLIISAGIDPEALIKYVSIIDEISEKKYDFYLRYLSATPDALVLYCIPKDKDR